MAATVTLIAHTTTNSDPVAFDYTSSSLSFSTGSGTTDNTPALAAGDVLVIRVEDLAAGATLAVSALTTGTGSVTFEGTTSGSYSSSTWNATSSDADNTKQVGSTITSTVWSTRIATGTPGNGSWGVRIAPDFASSTGARRLFIYKLTPDTGQNIPARSSRVAATGNAGNTNTGAGQTDNIALTGSIPSDNICLFVTGNPTSGTSGINVDADNDTTFELTTLDFTQTAGITGISKIYASGDAHRPSTTVPVKNVASPGSGGHVSTVTVYHMQVTATTVNGTASFSGGGTVSASGTVTVPGTASFAGGGNLIQATGTPTVIGTASLSGGGTFTASQQGVNTVNGTASLSGGGTFTANGHRDRTGTAAFSGGGVLSASGTPTVRGTAAFAGGGTFTAAQLQAIHAYNSGGTWSSASQVQLGGRTITATSAAFAGGGTFSATGHTAAHNSGIAFFIGGGTFTATGTKTVRGTATFSGGGVFRALSIPPSEPPTRLCFDRNSRLTLDRNSRLVLEH